MNIASIEATAWSCALVLWTFASEHPALTTMILGSIFARLGKMESPEHYALIAAREPVWFFSRWAAFRQLLAAVFSDTTKSKKIIAKIIAGPPKPPTGRSLVPSSDPPPPSVPPRAARMILVACVLSLLVATPGCSLLTKRNAKTVLDAAAFACVWGNALTDESAVADACGIARTLIPVIRDLIGEREAAKRAAASRAGVHWTGPSVDAGPADANSQ